MQDLKALTMNTGDTEQKVRILWIVSWIITTDFQSVKMPLFPQNHKIECTTDVSLKNKFQGKQGKHFICIGFIIII